MASRTYKDAVEHLNSQQSNAATLESIRLSRGKLNDVAISEMIEYLERIGHKAESLNTLNVIHVTGTKGKGSTCAFCDSILREALPGKKIGLYTSPHIVAVRERIRINGIPLSEEEFAKYFFEVWDLLEKNDKASLPNTPSKPNYFRLVTLVAYHTFLSLKVDATILEVGIGGLYDSTNIVPRPIVTGVSAIGFDHVNTLGNTLREIAFNKGGIFKKGVPAFSVEQTEEAMDMLRQRALERESVEFKVVPVLPELSGLDLGLAGDHQRQNASLALHLAQSFLQQLHGSSQSVSLLPLSGAFITGLERARWPGRCQEVQDPGRTRTTWFLDGAHTVESLVCGMEWFSRPDVGFKPDSNPDGTIRILIFNCTYGRSGDKFLGVMLDTLAAQLKSHLFDHALFCTNVTYTDGGFKPDFTSHAIATNDPASLTTQNELALSWIKLIPDYPNSNVKVLPSIQHAVEVVRSLETLEKSINILVCGSLHLVGGVIEVAGLSDIALQS
ncbi:FolC bifunctional protein [Hysterangium stoloniferum]|nr:FolC bifunctional protein [Hysterangium stoloniferum]